MASAIVVLTNDGSGEAVGWWVCTRLGWCVVVVSYLFGVMWESSIQDPNPVDFGLPPGDITTPASSGVCAGTVLMGGNILRGQTCQLRGGAVVASRFNGDQLAILTNTSRCDVRGEAASAVAGRWVLRACRFGRRDASGVLVLAERRVEQGGRSRDWARCEAWWAGPRVLSLSEPQK